MQPVVHSNELVCGAAALLMLVGFSGSALAGTDADGIILNGSPLTLAQSTTALSPPALQFQRDGRLHAAWIEKSGSQGEVKTAAIPADRSPVAQIAVNAPGGGPEALHQSPGFAIALDGGQYITWSTANKVPGALFASDLRLARSAAGSEHFQAPVQVNDDGLAISHTFEHVVAGKDGEVSIAWLDGRNKDRSGASILFACSRDHGATVGKNLVLDGMACPCCRPMLAQAPDGGLWAVWRKTFEGNVRDIVVARSSDHGRSFSAPMLVSQDGWVFDACPHRGPSIAFDAGGRLYVGWYTEGKDEQPRLFVSTSDDQGVTWSTPFALHTATTSLPDNLQLAVHPDGQVVAVWEEVTGVRKRVVVRVSTDRGQTFGAMQTLSSGSKGEHPTLAIHDSGAVAFGWTEHAFPHNRIMVQQGRLPRVGTP